MHGDGRKGEGVIVLQTAPEYPSRQKRPVLSDAP